MADKDSEDTPSLELPSFGFGRKKSKDEPAEPVEPVEAATPPTPSESAAEATPTSTAAEIAAPAATPPVRPRAARKPAPAVTAPAPSAHEPVVAPAAEPTQVKAPRQMPSFPAIGALQAALAVGALVGILAVLLTFGSLKLCELARGTDSCGGGPGLLLLVATLIALTYLGSWLLRGFGIGDAGSTSFLAVGLLAVTVMTFFLDAIYSRWMVLVIPLVSMAMFALAWWVTTRVVETDDASRRTQDVRYRE